ASRSSSCGTAPAPKEDDMKKKLMIVVPILLVVLGGAYKMVLAPKPASAKEKIQGSLLELSPEFIVNLAGGRYGKLSVAVLLGSPPPKSAEGTVPTLKQDAAVRAVITDTLTGANADELISRTARHRLLTR